MFRVRVLLLSVAAAAVIAPPSLAASSEPPLASCGGLSPVDLHCSATAMLPDDVSKVGLNTSADASYVGRVFARAETATGSKEIDCKYYGGSLGLCEEREAGRFEPGQVMTLIASLGGFESPLPPGVGNWNAEVLADPFAS
jgi:hypothetical protein